MLDLVLTVFLVVEGKLEVPIPDVYHKLLLLVYHLLGPLQTME